MLKVLVVDDSAIARMMISKCIEMTTDGVIELVDANNGVEAIGLIKKDRPHLVISDLNMPVMDGTALLRRIKASPKWCELPVIIITSAGNRQRESELKEQGAELVLNKPISPPDISIALDSLKCKGVIQL